MPATWLSGSTTRPQPLVCRDHISVIPCGICGGRIGVGGRFLLLEGFLSFSPALNFIPPNSPLSSHSFPLALIHPCHGASDLVNQHPCLSQTFIKKLYLISFSKAGPEIILIYFIIIRVFCARAGLSLQAQERRVQFCRRQVFHRKLRNQSCSFIRN